MGARTVVKRTKGAVKRIAKEPKAAAKAAMKPATAAESRLVMIGALASPLVNTGYSYAYNWIITKVPFLTENPIISQIIKILAPAVPAFIFQQFKLPFGNLVNGCLYGIIAAQAINLGFMLLMGKPLPEKATVDATELEITTEPITPWDKS